MAANSSSNGLSTITSHNIDQLVAEDKLLRILRSDLREQVEQAVEAGSEGHQYVLKYKDHLYLSCAQIKDPQQRKRVYHLLQRYQLGERVDLTPLPPELQRLLRPKLTRVGRFLGSLLIGGAVGVASGVLAMSVSILLVTMSEWLRTRPFLDFAGMGFTAVTFVIFCLLGWVAGAFIAWHRYWQWQNKV